MSKIHIQIRRLYLAAVIKNLSLTGGWVALLAARGFSLVEIGLTETVFHLTSLCFEIPSGALADVLGRKKMLLLGLCFQQLASLMMMGSRGLGSVCLAIAFLALSYNCASGAEEALAYETLAQAGRAGDFEGYQANQFTIYRICTGLSTLCVGLALTIGYRWAYALDLLMATAALAVTAGLRETGAAAPWQELGRRVRACFRESFRFLSHSPQALGLMVGNSLVGALDVLLLFFLQARLPEKGCAPWLLGAALLFMQTGGVLGAQVILRIRLRYRWVFALTLMLAVGGILAEALPWWWAVTLAGFVTALADDALQVRTSGLLQQMFPQEQRATLVSVESFLFSLVMMGLSPAAGWFFTWW